MRTILNNHKIQASYLSLLFFAPIFLAFVHLTQNIEFMSNDSSEIVLNIAQIETAPAMDNQIEAAPTEEIVEEQAVEEEAVEALEEPLPEPIFEPEPLPEPAPKPVIEKPKPVVKKVEKKEVKKVAKPVQNANPTNATPTNSAPSNNANQEDLMVYGKSSDPFLQAIQATIRKTIKYPQIARRMSMQGEVWVEFIWDKNILKSVKIIKESKHKILNEDAIKTIEKAAKKFPTYSKNVKIQIPITYILK